VTRPTGQQHGHAYFKYDSPDQADPRHQKKREIARLRGAATQNQPDMEREGGRLMVGFEGSGPSQNSLVGQHGALSMVPGLAKSRPSITGQQKGKKIGLPSGLGAVRADVREDDMDRLKNVWQQLDTIKGTEQESDIMRRLLSARTVETRLAIIDEIENLPSARR